MLSFSQETSHWAWFPNPQPPKQQGKTSQQTNLSSVLGGQLELTWPGSCREQPSRTQQSPNCLAVFGASRQSPNPLAAKSSLETEMLPRGIKPKLARWAPGRETETSSSGGRRKKKLGIGNDEADQASSICCWRVAQSWVYLICLAEGRAGGCYLGEQGQPPSIPSIIADLAAAQGGSILPLNPFSASKCPLLGVKWYLNPKSITAHDHQFILQHQEPVGSAE